MDKSTRESIETKINNFKNWQSEDIPIGPSDIVLNTAKSLSNELMLKDIFPFRITPIMDGGICLVYKMMDLLVYVELDNDGDIGLISENVTRKSIINNIDLLEGDVAPTLIRILNDCN